MCCPPAAPTMMGFFVIHTFVIGAVSFKNIMVAPVSSSPVFLFSTIFCLGVVQYF